VEGNDDAYYECDLCPFRGCLRCKELHSGNCKKAEELNEETRKRVEFLLEQGKLAPPEGGHPTDPKHPDYLKGRYRVCPAEKCKIITERPLDGTHHEGQCNAMICAVASCKMHWHWNWGRHEDHPDFNKVPGTREMHDFTLDIMHYSAEGAHF